MKIFCFGELLLRMSPELNRLWINNTPTAVYIGGAELNVATALSTWGLKTGYCTALPDHYLSREIEEELTAAGIDTTPIQWQEGRIGTYYLPQGTDLKNAAVIYDRDHSSFANLRPDTLDWNMLLEGYQWFHFSAISPALNEPLFKVCREALETASRKGLRISIDLNYRSKLWKYGKQPAALVPELAGYCDVVMGNIWAAEQLLGITSPIPESAGRSKEELINAAFESMEQVQYRFPHMKTLAYTYRLPQHYFAVMQHKGEKIISKEFALRNIVDQVGSGDCFMGGLIYGLSQQHHPVDLLNVAAASAVGKMKEKGDRTRNTMATIAQIIEQDGK